MQQNLDVWRQMTWPEFQSVCADQVGQDLAALVQSGMIPARFSHLDTLNEVIVPGERFPLARSDNQLSGNPGTNTVQMPAVQFLLAVSESVRKVLAQLETHETNGNGIGDVGLRETAVREAARAELVQFLRKEIQVEDGIDSFDGVETAQAFGVSDVANSTTEPLPDMSTMIDVAKKRLRHEGVERYLRMRQCVRANLAALIWAAQAARPKYTEEELQTIMVIPNNGPGHKLSDFIDEFKRMIKEDAR